MRLFLALWPAPAERARLARWAAQWQWPPAARRTPLERLHLTLHFLGEVPPARLPALALALRPVAAVDFELGPGQAEVWANGVAAWCPLDPPAGLHGLQAALGRGLQDAGFTLESRRWRPHVTLARAAAGAQAPAQPLHWRWPVRGWVLVESAGGGGGGYRVLASYR